MHRVALGFDQFFEVVLRIPMEKNKVFLQSCTLRFLDLEDMVSEPDSMTGVMVSEPVDILLEPVDMVVL